MKAGARSTRARTPKPVTAFLGSDDAKVMAAAREFAAANVPPEAGDFGLETIDGTADNADAAVERVHATIDALLTLPFLGGGKLVWLKNASFLGDTVTGRAESVLAATEKLVETLESGLPDGIRFLLSATEIDKRRSFYKRLGKLADVEVFDRIDASRAGWEEQVARLVREQADALGIRLERDALDLFIARCGPDGRLIESELEKLALFEGDGGVVTEARVRELVPDSSSGVIWELGNAMARRDSVRCLELLDRLLRQGESAVGILLAAIAPTLRNLLAVRHLIDRHGIRPGGNPRDFGRALERLPEHALRGLPRKKDGGINAFALGLAASQAHRFTLSELADAMEACLQANVALVTSSLDPRVALSRLLLRISGVDARPAPAFRRS